MDDIGSFPDLRERGAHPHMRLRPNMFVDLARGRGYLDQLARDDRSRLRDDDRAVPRLHQGAVELGEHLLRPAGGVVGDGRERKGDADHRQGHAIALARSRHRSEVSAQPKPSYRQPSPGGGRVKS